MKDVILIILIGLFLGMGFVPIHMADGFLVRSRREIEKGRVDKKGRRASGIGRRR